MQALSIDLVVDEVPLGEVEAVTPADRLPVEGVAVCDYLVYPVENALSDKVCAIVEHHCGRPSSRVKDLVDILVYAATCRVDGDGLADALRREAAVRRVELPARFAVPDRWLSSYGHQFSKLLAQTGLGGAYGSIQDAADAAGVLVDPALSGESRGMEWDPAGRAWRQRDGG